MLRWLSCHLFRAHDYAVRCESTGVYLQCAECGSRSHGWQMGPTGPMAPTFQKPERVRRVFGRLRAVIAGLSAVDLLRRF